MVFLCFLSSEFSPKQCQPLTLFFFNVFQFFFVRGAQDFSLRVACTRSQDWLHRAWSITNSPLLAHWHPELPKPSGSRRRIQRLGRSGNTNIMYTVFTYSDPQRPFLHQNCHRDLCVLLLLSSLCVPSAARAAGRHRGHTITELLLYPYSYSSLSSIRTPSSCREREVVCSIEFSYYTYADGITIDTALT